MSCRYNIDLCKTWKAVFTWSPRWTQRGCWVVWTLACAVQCRRPAGGASGSTSLWAGMRGEHCKPSCKTRLSCLPQGAMVADASCDSRSDSGTGGSFTRSTGGRGGPSLVSAAAWTSPSRGPALINLPLPPLRWSFLGWVALVAASCGCPLLGYF